MIYSFKAAFKHILLVSVIQKLSLWEFSSFRVIHIYRIYHINCANNIMILLMS